MPTEKYEPTSEEIEKAEETMSDEEEKMSEERERALIEESEGKLILKNEEAFLKRLEDMKKKADDWKVKEFGKTKILLAAQYNRYPSGRVVDERLSAQAIYSPERVVPFYFRGKMKDYMDKNFPGWHREFAGFLDLGLDKENDIRAYASEGWGSH